MGKNGYTYMYDWVPWVVHLRLSQRCFLIDYITIKNKTFFFLRASVKDWNACTLVSLNVFDNDIMHSSKETKGDKGLRSYIDKLCVVLKNGTEYLV